MLPSKKFLLGLALIIGNFILGKLALPFFAISMELGLAIYLFSWLMFLIGLVLCGREGLAWARVYYRHFEKKLKHHMLNGLKHSRSKNQSLQTLKKLDQPSPTTDESWTMTNKKKSKAMAVVDESS
ncbi:MAG: hypothetical protein Q9P14_07525 [candidate division KSB1 bacterium]|nr:hypothetical protein [candidate division KSB1 bacterium]MDQ7062936.1 hypothetical protein [candidate division KSB1 bacterium]